MSEQRENNPNNAPLVPLSEADLNPISPLSPAQVLGIGSAYLKASHEVNKLGQKLNKEDNVDPDTIETFHHETGRQEAFRTVLGLLGQQRLINRVDAGLRELFPEEQD